MGKRTGRASARSLLSKELHRRRGGHEFMVLSHVVHGEVGHAKGHFHQWVDDAGDIATNLQDNVEGCRSLHPFPLVLPVFDMGVFLAEIKT